MTASTNRSFKTNILWMKFFGLYPSDSVFGKVKGAVFYIFIYAVVDISVIIKFFLRDTDVVQTNFNMIFLANMTAFCFKLPTFLQYKHRIKKCIDLFDDPIFAAKDSTERKLIEKCVLICQRSTRGFLVVTTIAVTVWALPFLVAYKFPVDLWLPYNTTKPLVYYPTFFYMVTSVMCDALIETVMDPLIGGLALHATTHLKILKYNLQNLARYVESPMSNDRSLINYEYLGKFLKNCIKRHKKILAFVTEYERCFSFIVFCQFAGSTFTLCFTLIGLLQQAAMNTETVTCMASFCFAAFEILFYCYFGTLLYEENKGFTQSIYMGPWYEYDVKIRKVLIIMMERSKKPLIVTAGKVVDITIQTFASVLKTSYSLIAVFK